MDAMKIRGQTVYPLKQRLEMLSKEVPSGCIEWISSIRNGYGYLIIGSRSDGTRKSVFAHRLSYEVHVGAIPKGLFICHHCDNKKCINPKHLFVGTRQDNVDDRENKGRNRLPKFNHRNHSNCKLHWGAIKKIRGSKLKPKELSKQFGVAGRTIRDIINFVSWIPEPPQ